MPCTTVCRYTVWRGSSELDISTLFGTIDIDSGGLFFFPSVLEPRASLLRTWSGPREHTYTTTTFLYHTITISYLSTCLISKTVPRLLHPSQTNLPLLPPTLHSRSSSKTSAPHWGPALGLIPMMSTHSISSAWWSIMSPSRVSGRRMPWGIIAGRIRGILLMRGMGRVTWWVAFLAEISSEIPRDRVTGFHITSEWHADGNYSLYWFGAPVKGVWSMTMPTHIVSWRLVYAFINHRAAF